MGYSLLPLLYGAGSRNAGQTDTPSLCRKFRKQWHDRWITDLAESGGGKATQLLPPPGGEPVAAPEQSRNYRDGTPVADPAEGRKSIPF
jgi:hypothetical protein